MSLNRTALTRRRMLARIAALAGGAFATWPRHTAAQSKPSIIVYKDPACGCCHQWVQHMQGEGFVATVIDGDLTPIRSRYKVGSRLQSCHTAILGNYVIEGHVPASDVRTFMARPPKGAIGVTIPGMPASAPGMDGRPFVPFTVLAFDAQGNTSVFKTHTKADW